MSNDDSLDDGPVLTGRLCPPASAPPVTSGLIDLRAMAMAYRKETSAVPAPPLVVAEGSQPVVILETQASAHPRRSARLARAARAVALLALGGAAFALVSDLAARTAPPRPAEPVSFTPGPPMRRTAEAASSMAPHEPPRSAQASNQLPLEVIYLPTTITELDQEPEPEPEPEPPSTGPPIAPTSATLAPARLPTRPSNSEIANAIVDAQDHLERCRDRFGESGLVPIEIEVEPAGTITSVAVGRGSTGFRACIRDSVGRQRLPASTQGTRAKFPIWVR